MVQIFLAHASEDKAKVMELYEHLKKKGYKPWLDKKDLLGGQLWDDEIKKAINSSDVFLACLSQRSVEKQGYVQKEFRMALQKCGELPDGKIYLIPLRLDDCEIPNLRQREYGVNIRDYQWVDLFEPDGFEQLVKSIDYHFPVDRTPKAGKTQLVYLGNSANIKLVYIPGGSFLMGAPENEEGSSNSEKPQHTVTVPECWMSRFLVTQAQYEAVMGNNPSSSSLGGNNPVEQVSWHDAIAFCRKASQKTGMNFRLPSEAEWEYACRAGTTTPFYFGKSISGDQANFHKEGTTPVGKYPINAFGLCDMHGNVWEWCQDYWHGNYKGAPDDGSAWLEAGKDLIRVLRGGSWRFDPEYSRSAYRFKLPFGHRDDNIGFRVVCSRLPDSIKSTEKKKIVYADSTEVTNDGEIKNILSAGTF
ncbi:SUMF1/EgtB/PvdO family nonheme iron enzyme [Leptothoe sp. EHU-05/26/07-4]